MKVLTVVGARPQFIKCAPVSRALRVRHDEVLLHTGQHYDHGMSERFFDELGIPEPRYDLEVGSGTHGQMTARMLERIEPLIVAERPDWVLVYGDTNSTLAGALAAAKLHVPVAHVEAGLRSFNRRMPEEINRVVVDHVSHVLFCPTANAVRLLAKEGVTERVFEVGDVMFDSVLAQLERARSLHSVERLCASLDFHPDPTGRFAFATVHRPENTDHPERLGSILDGLSSLSMPVLLPLHPRTRKLLDASEDLRERVGPNVKVVPPIGYLELLVLAAAARVVLTDSGGLQKEALFLGVRCVTLRDETEWVETLEHGCNRIAGAASHVIREAAEQADRDGPFDPARAAAGAFGDGRAAEKIVSLLERVPRAL